MRCSSLSAVAHVTGSRETNEKGAGSKTTKIIHLILFLFLGNARYNVNMYKIQKKGTRLVKMKR